MARASRPRRRRAPAIPLHLEPACDLAPAAGLSWVVDAKPRAVAEIPDLIPAIALVLPEERLGAFTKAHGGIDLRQIQDLCVARYKDALLTVARVPLDPERIAAAFEERATSTVTRAFLAPNPRVTRLSAEIDAEPRQLLVFGRESVAEERGKPGPLRAAEAFAFGKLKKAAPALRGAALQRMTEVLGDKAPVRIFAPGPFEGGDRDWAWWPLAGGHRRGCVSSVGGHRDEHRGSRRAHRGLGRGRPAAAERFGAAAHVISESALGHLLDFTNRSRRLPVRVEPDALVLDAVIDGAALARGIHDAVDARGYRHHAASERALASMWAAALRISQQDRDAVARVCAYYEESDVLRFPRLLRRSWTHDTR